MKSKTIILSSLDNHNPRAARGILTLTNENNTQGKLRLYNIVQLPQGSKLGIYSQGKAQTTSLVYQNGAYTCKFDNAINLDEDFYTAVVDVNDNNKVVVAGGTYAGYFFEDNNQTNKETETLDKEEDIENLIDKELDDDECRGNCANCKYKEFFYSEHSSTSDNSNNICHTNNNDPQPCANSIYNMQQMQESKNQNEMDENVAEKAPQTILGAIVPQFDYIFKNCPANNELNERIENSKFVEMNEASEQYSIGAIFEDDKIKYICYAVKAEYNTPAPSELGEFHQWLPLDPDDPLSVGYHIVFQDATDLKIIEI